MAVPLADFWDQVVTAIRAAPRLLIGCDFDGTLVPIRNRPEECYLDTAVARTLAELAECARIRVGIVSGRELADLRARVGLPGVACAGNHGLEIDTPTVKFRHPDAVAARPALEQVIHDLRRELVGIPGAWVEDKGLTCSVHLRQVPPSLMPSVEVTVRQFAREPIASGMLVIRTGKAVLELRPAVAWNKGSSVQWLAAHLFAPGPAPLVLYIGDDDTDEDVFRILDASIGIVVGDRPATAAQYYIPDCDAVQRLLGWFVSLAHDSVI